MIKYLTKTTWTVLPILFIGVFLTYTFILNSVIFPSKEDLINSDAFEWKSEKSALRLDVAFRWSLEDFTNNTNKDILYKIENKALMSPLDSRIILKDIIVENENVHLNLEIDHSLKMLEGAILTVENYENQHSSLAQLTVNAHDQFGEIPVKVSVKEDNITLTVDEERFFKMDFFSLSITGFYSLEYRRNWYLF